MATSTIKQVTNNSGSNYCKMPDGTLIQWGKESVASKTEKASLGYHGSKAVTFAMAFVSLPVVIVCPHEDAGYWNSGCTDITNIGFKASIAGDQPSVARTVEWLAIGRWK